VHGKCRIAPDRRQIVGYLEAWKLNAGNRMPRGSQSVIYSALATSTAISSCVSLPCNKESRESSMENLGTIPILRKN